MKKPYEIINKQRVFDFKKTILYIQHIGKLKYGPGFKINPSDIPTFHKLIIYMIHEENQCLKHGIDLKKGILLTGPIGSGKTFIMTLLRIFLFNEDLHTIKSSRHIALEYQKDGVDVINK